MKYAFNLTTSQSGGGGKGDAHIDTGKDRYENLKGHIGRLTVIDTTHLIGLRFSPRRIESEFLWKK